ncbi:MAG TPA: restriction endonuclease [Anaerolineales bacterium]|nr:restriction endonuclease [Anaerolineales bacterium]
MPSVRRSTGRAVTPVRQPEVASAKQTQLFPPPMAAFPHPSELEIEFDGAVQPLAARLPPAMLGKVALEPLAAPGLEALPARLFPEEDLQRLTAPFDVNTPIGVCWADPGPAPDEDHRFLWEMRPRLAGGVFEQAAVLPAFPTQVRGDQQEAVQRLLKEPDLLLLSDPGCGMDAAVALALRELFRLGEIERALILASHETQRPWSALLSAWAGELRVTCGATESGLWPGHAEVWVVEPRTIAGRLRTSPAAARDLACDVVLLTDYAAHRRREFDPTSLATLPAKHHWVSSGGPPPEAEDWRLLHRYLHPEWSGPAALADIQERLRTQTIRQTKAAVQAELPRRSRVEVWFDLEGEQRAAYQGALAEERARLEGLGGAVNRTHVSAALSRLKRILAFQPGTLDGVKVRALVDLTEEVLASGSKLVVVSPPDLQTLASLASVLDAYGAVRLDSTAAPEAQSVAIGDFRRGPARRVLLADSEARGDGEPFHEATYVIHFSHDWNPAHRRRVEQRLYPDLGPGPALTVYEYWVADTVEERYHHLLDSQGLLARDVALETRPKDIEEKLTMQHWMRDVFEVGPAEPGRRSGKPGGTGQLPGTGDLRRAWSAFDDEGLAGAAESLIRALGFTQVERVRPPDSSGCDFLAWVTSPSGAARIFIRCLRLEAAGEVEEGEAILDELKDRPDCVGAYLIATTEFTPACRRLAEASDGRLALVDGSEFLRHLRVLGLVG